MKMKIINRFLIAASAAFLPCIALAGNGAIKMAHKEGFFGCGGIIAKSQKQANGWIDKGTAGNWYTKVDSIGVGKKVNGVTIIDYLDDTSTVSEITKTGPAKSCQVSTYFTAIFMHHNCESQMSGDSILTDAGDDYIVARTQGGSLATFRPINGGSGCVEQIYVINQQFS